MDIKLDFRKCNIDGNELIFIWAESLHLSLGIKGQFKNWFDHIVLTLELKLDVDYIYAAPANDEDLPGRRTYLEIHTAIACIYASGKTSTTKAVREKLRDISSFNAKDIDLFTKTLDSLAATRKELMQCKIEIVNLRSYASLLSIRNSARAQELVEKNALAKDDISALKFKISTLEEKLATNSDSYIKIIQDARFETKKDLEQLSLEISKDCLGKNLIDTLETEIASLQKQLDTMAKKEKWQKKDLPVEKKDATVHKSIATNHTKTYSIKTRDIPDVILSEVFRRIFNQDGTADMSRDLLLKHSDIELFRRYFDRMMQGKDKNDNSLNTVIDSAKALLKQSIPRALVAAMAQVDAGVDIVEVAEKHLLHYSTIKRHLERKK